MRIYNLLRKSVQKTRASGFSDVIVSSEFEQYSAFPSLQANCSRQQLACIVLKMVTDTLKE